MLNHLFLNDFVPYIVVFCRLLGMMMSMPFIGQAEISGRFRLMAALGFAYLLSPLLPHQEIDATMAFVPFAITCAKELIIGYFVGLIGKLLINILDFTGFIISGQMGLSSATTFNPSMASQTSIPSVILTTFGMAIFLSFDLHHLIFLGLVKSYVLFPLTHKIMYGDLSKGFIDTFSLIFSMGLQLAMPFIIVFIVMQIGFGLMNRMIPQMQIFFVSMPLQIWGGLVVLMMTSSIIITRFGFLFDREYRAFFKLG